VSHIRHDSTSSNLKQQDPKRFINISPKIKNFDLIKTATTSAVIGFAIILIGMLNNILPESQSQEEEDRNFENVTLLIEKADQFYDSGQKEAAIKYYQMVLAINKTDSYALNSIGDSLYDLERYDDAINYYEKTLAINKSDTYALTSIGDSLNSMEKYSEAQKYLDMALSIDENYTYALNAKGNVFYNLGQYDEAINYYDRTLAINKNDSYALTSVGDSLNRLGRYDNALQFFDMALEIDANDTYAKDTKVDTLRRLGDNYYSEGKYEDAIKYYDKALAINPAYSDAKGMRALSSTHLANQGKTAEPKIPDKVNIDRNYPLVTLNFIFDNYLSFGIAAAIVIALIIFFGGLRMVRPTHRGAIERLSRYHRFMKSGITWIIPGIDRIYPVNITEQMADADQQEIITKDNLNAFVDVQIYFKVKEDEDSVKAALYNVNDYRLQIISLARTTLRNVIGNKEFSQVNNNRTQLNKEILESIQQQTANWGLEIVRCELKEIQPPADVQQTMNTVLKAQNEKQAAIDFATARETAADGEKRAAIKQAEGQMQSAVLKAQGEAQAILKVAEARSKEIQIINESAQKYFVGNAQVLKQLEVSETAMKDNTKFVIAEKGTNPVIVFGQDGNPTNNVIVTKPKDKYPSDIT